MQKKKNEIEKLANYSVGGKKVKHFQPYLILFAEASLDRP